jgi:pyruvate/2-oxoglutarate/acetoin dehydrogenase E1 component
VRRLHGAFAPTPYSQTLEKQVVPGPDEIVQAVRELMEE